MCPIKTLMFLLVTAVALPQTHAADQTHTSGLRGENNPLLDVSHIPTYASKDPSAQSAIESPSFYNTTGASRTVMSSRVLRAQDYMQLSDSSTPQYTEWAASRLNQYGDTCSTEQLPMWDNTDSGYIRFNAGVQCSSKRSVMSNDIMTKEKYDLSGGYEVDYFVNGAGDWCCCFYHSIGTADSFLDRQKFGECCLSVHHSNSGSHDIGDGVVTTFALTIGLEKEDGSCEYTATTYRKDHGYIWQQNTGVIAVCRDLRAVNLAFHLRDCYEKTAASMQISSILRVGTPQDFFETSPPTLRPTPHSLTVQPSVEPGPDTPSAAPTSSASSHRATSLFAFSVLLSVVLHCF